MRAARRTPPPFHRRGNRGEPGRKDGGERLTLHPGTPRVARCARPPSGGPVCLPAPSSVSFMSHKSRQNYSHGHLDFKHRYQRRRETVSAPDDPGTAEPAAELCRAAGPHPFLDTRHSPLHWRAPAQGGSETFKFSLFKELGRARRGLEGRRTQRPQRNPSTAPPPGDRGQGPVGPLRPPPAPENPSAVAPASSYLCRCTKVLAGFLRGQLAAQ